MLIYMAIQAGLWKENLLEDFPKQRGILSLPSLQDEPLPL